MTIKILRLPDVMRITALSRSSIYAFVREKAFPQPIPLGIRAVGWDESEVLEWLSKRAEMRKA